MSRLAATFERLRSTGRAGLVAYVTSGDPDLATSRRILLALERGGADVIEVGVPFSDPLADGPAIQRASERALAAGGSLRTALATIRAARSVASLSIVLMTPNSTSDTPNARDELWYEQIVPGIKQAARDFNCCFVDTYAWLRDSRPAAGVWMDNPLPGGGRAIHPLNVMNTWIAGLLGQVLFPEGLATSVGRTSIISVGGAEDIGDVNRVPSYYGYGLTISRAGDGSGFPFNGILQTVRAHDEVVMQYCYSFTIVDGSRFAYRVGRAVALGGNPAGWEAWVTFGATQLGLVTASAGYAQPVNGALRVAKAGAVNTIEGYISKSAPAVIAANTQIGTIPAGFRPTREATVGHYATGYDGADWEPLLVLISTTGAIQVVKASTLSIQRVYVSATWNTDNPN